MRLISIRKNYQERVFLVILKSTFCYKIKKIIIKAFAKNNLTKALFFNLILQFLVFNIKTARFRLRTA